MHYLTDHLQNLLTCKSCDKVFKNKQGLSKHTKMCHKTDLPKPTRRSPRIKRKTPINSIFTKLQCIKEAMNEEFQKIPKDKEILKIPKDTESNFKN